MFVLLICLFVQFQCHLLLGLLILKGFSLCLVLFFCLILLFSVEIKHYKSLGYVFLFSFLNFLPSVHSLGLAQIAGHMRFVTLSLFCSSLLHFSSLTPYLLSVVVVLGHGGAVADFSMRGLSNLYSDSKKRIRTSYQSKSCLQWKGDRGNTTARRQPTDNGMLLIKICYFDDVYKRKNYHHILYYTQYSIIYSNSVHCYRISHILNCIHRNIQLQPLIVSLLSVLLICAKGLCNEPITHDHVLTLYKKEN